MADRLFLPSHLHGAGGNIIKNDITPITKSLHTWALDASEFCYKILKV